jgi:hypothetical protein
MRSITSTLARRLAITRQCLSGPRAPANPDGLLGVVRDLGCLQLDPISAVARSHQLVLFSRVGKYDLADLDRLLWSDRSLFEYWAHVASIVLTEDYPIHQWMMRRHGRDESQWAFRTRAWIEKNRSLRRHILNELKRNGPLPSRYFEDKAAEGWYSTGWTSERNVSRMIDFLWLQGTIMVAGRQGIQKLWDLSERVLPEWTPRETLSEREMVYRAAQKAIRALGVTTPQHIRYHYIRGRYPDLPQALDRLERDGRIERVEIRDGRQAWPGTWHIHVDDLPVLERLANGDWKPRTTLLSPFDNLICDRKRTQLLFDFDFTMEIYVPPAKRKYGYYVLPILHGDRFIGRVDPKLDRERGVLTINAVHAEPDSAKSRTAAHAAATAIEELAGFLGASDIEYDRKRLPPAWKRNLIR